MKGYVHIYTGDGKGKTTAALGLALRAAGAGLRVLVAQFVKGKLYSEMKSLERLKPQVELRRYGRPGFIHDEPSPEDVRAAREGLDDARAAMKTGGFDVVILDEIMIALFFKMISEDEIAALMKEKPENVELILTGRRAPRSLIARADLVTEMKEIKHYYQKGVPARDGVEK